MNSELDHDLTAWADGSLSREDLITLHGREGRALMTLHERLLGAAEMPAPDPVAGWALLQGRMDAKVTPLRTGARPRPRRAILAVAAALLIGGGALAAIRGVTVDHPGVVNPPARTPASPDGNRGRSHGQPGARSGFTGDRPGGGISSSIPTLGSVDPVEGPTGSDATSTSDGTTGDGTIGGGTSDGGGDSGTTGDGGTQGPDGQHPGQGNGGQDNGNDGPHGHGGASSAHA